MSLAPGQTLLHYRLVDKIGEGGMGEVWKAEDTKLDREVALKILPTEFAANSERRNRFNREAKAIAALNHPNIVTVHSVEEAEGLHFLTMELVPGRPLTETIKKEALPLGRFFEIAVPIADALSEAHRNGITHRDLKPANVMIGPKGRVKILDFGLAKLRETDPTEAAGTQLPTTSVTKEGKIVGTVSYMSPEQAEGKAVDYRSDIFSLGIVLYEMATGRRPFRGDTSMSVLSSIIKDEPRSVTAINQGLPHHLGRIIGRCLAKEPDLRYQSTQDLRNELDGLQREVTSGELSATMEGATSTAGPRTSRSWFPWAILGAIVLVAAGVFWALRSWGPDESAQRGEARSAPATPVTKAPGAKPPSGDDRKMAVVLPFENLGPPEDAHFAAGMSEEISSRLAAVRGLGVISRTSATQYDRTGKAIRQIGADLGVDYVLDGTVRWAKRADGTGRVRVTPQLIRVADDTQIWSETYDRGIEDVFEVQTDIANRVIDQLDITLLAAERDLVEDAPTRNMEAYELYIKAKNLENENIGSFLEYDARFVALMEKAITLDPGFIDAWAHLSMYHSHIYFLLDRTERRLSQARKAMQGAEEIDPDAYQTHLARGVYHYHGFRDYDQALEEFLAATAIVPSEALAQNLVGLIYRRQGRWNESIESLDAAFRLDPQDGKIASGLAETHLAIREFAEALHYYDRAIELEPQEYRNVWKKAEAMLRWKGDFEAARDILERKPEGNDFLYRIGWFLVNFWSRDYSQAIEQARQMDPPSPSLRALRFHMISAVDAKENGVEAARSTLEEANRELESVLESEPGNSNLRKWLSRNLALLGRDAAAVREAKLAVDQTAKDRFAGPQALENLAAVYGIVGRHDEAIDLIERLLETAYEDPITPRILAMAPEWDRLRENPRFQALLPKNTSK
jgi:TolB-like protein/Flp pilus assembly protein TadD